MISYVNEIHLKINQIFFIHAVYLELSLSFLLTVTATPFFSKIYSLFFFRDLIEFEYTENYIIYNSFGNDLYVMTWQCCSQDLQMLTLPIHNLGKNIINRMQLSYKTLLLVMLWLCFLALSAAPQTLVFVMLNITNSVSPNAFYFFF